MPQLFGRAAIVWTDPADPVIERVYLLRVPLQKVVHGTRQRVYVAESLDFTNRETISVGKGVYELVGQVRYDEDPQGLADMIAAGSRGVTLTLVPDTEALEEFACSLIEPVAMPFTPEQEVDFRSFMETTTTIRLRRTNGAFFS